MCIDALLEACKNNTVSKILGFGAKTQENIVKAIEAYRSNEDKFHYASVADFKIIKLKLLQQRN